MNSLFDQQQRDGTDCKLYDNEPSHNLEIFPSASFLEGFADMVVKRCSDLFHKGGILHTENFLGYSKDCQLEKPQAAVEDHNYGKRYE